MKASKCEIENCNNDVVSGLEKPTRCIDHVDKKDYVTCEKCNQSFLPTFMHICAQCDDCGMIILDQDGIDNHVCKSKKDDGMKDCEVPNCHNKVVCDGLWFCDEHNGKASKCIFCDGVVVENENHVCKGNASKCSKDGCSYNAFMGDYCVQHIDEVDNDEPNLCSQDGCCERIDKGIDFCYKHDELVKCLRVDCNEVVKKTKYMNDHRDYKCKKHQNTCSFEGCENHASDGMKFCKDHWDNMQRKVVMKKCAELGCDYMVNGNHGHSIFCAKHQTGSIDLSILPTVPEINAEIAKVGGFDTGEEAEFKVEGAIQAFFNDSGAICQWDQCTEHISSEFVYCKRHSEDFVEQQRKKMAILTAGIDKSQLVELAGEISNIGVRIGGADVEEEPVDNKMMCKYCGVGEIDTTGDCHVKFCDYCGKTVVVESDKLLPIDNAVESPGADPRGIDSALMKEPVSIGPDNGGPDRMFIVDNKPQRVTCQACEKITWAPGESYCVDHRYQKTCCIIECGQRGHNMGMICDFHMDKAFKDAVEVPLGMAKGGIVTRPSQDRIATVLSEGDCTIRDEDFAHRPHKPTVGMMPRFIWLEHRIKDLGKVISDLVLKHSFGIGDNGAEDFNHLLRLSNEIEYVSGELSKCKSDGVVNDESC